MGALRSPLGRRRAALPASFGWLTPAKIRKLEVSDEGRVAIAIRSLIPDFCLLKEADIQLTLWRKICVGSEVLACGICSEVSGRILRAQDLTMDPTRLALICAGRLRFMAGSCKSALVYYN